MKKVRSYGIIPLKKKDDGWHVLITRHYEGHWGFPKGRPEKDEQPLDTEKRELHEETGLDIVKLVKPEPLEEHYTFTKNDITFDKAVTYYIAEVEGVVILQHDEVLESMWVKVEEAEQYVSFPETKKLCAALSMFNDQCSM